MSAIVLANRDLGPEKIIAEAAASPAGITVARGREIFSGYQALTGAAPAVLNARPSFSVGA